jgi:hypothetical protein
MREAVQRHAETLVAAELRRLPAGERERVREACLQVAAALADGVLDEARLEPRLAAVLASIYGPRTTISAWPAEAVRRA